MGERKIESGCLWRGWEDRLGRSVGSAKDSETESVGIVARSNGPLARVTGFSAAAVARLLGRGEIRQMGNVAPEDGIAERHTINSLRNWRREEL
jgi:hypothetical protein